jgi:hypothetical protein
MELRASAGTSGADESRNEADARVTPLADGLGSKAPLSCWLVSKQAPLSWCLVSKQAPLSWWLASKRALLSC